MQKNLSTVFFMITLSVLFSNMLTSKEIQLKIYPEEKEEVTTSLERPYLFIGEELTEIRSILTEVRTLTKDSNITQSIDQLIDRYKKGFKTAPQELVVSALEEVELLIEKEHKILNDVKLRTISDNFAKCYKQIQNQELLIPMDQNTIRGPRNPKAPGDSSEEPPPEARITLHQIDKQKTSRLQTN